MGDINTALRDLFNAVDKLEKLLEPYQNEIAGICSKPLKEMGISEKVKLAKLVLAIRAETE